MPCEHGGASGSQEAEEQSQGAIFEADDRVVDDSAPPVEVRLAENEDGYLVEVNMAALDENGSPVYDEVGNPVFEARLDESRVGSGWWKFVL